MKKRKCLLMMMVLAWSAGTIFGQQKGESAFRSLHSRYRILPENIGFAILNADRAGYDEAQRAYLVMKAQEIAQRLEADSTLNVWDEEINVLRNTLDEKQFARLFRAKHARKTKQEADSIWARLTEAGLTNELDSAQEWNAVYRYITKKKSINDIYRHHSTERRIQLDELRLTRPILIRMAETLSRKEKGMPIRSKIPETTEQQYLLMTPGKSPQPRKAIYVLKGLDNTITNAEAIGILQDAATLEQDSNAMNALGVAYADGIGCEADSMQAIHWFEQAGDKGHPLAYHNLGIAYKRALAGLRQDFSRACHYFQMGAEKGAVACCYDYGFMLYKGLGCRQDYTKAVEWFESAAKKNHLPSLYMLGLCYRNGFGVEKDVEKGLSLLHKADVVGFGAATEELEREAGETYIYEDSESLATYKNLPQSMPDISSDFTDPQLLAGNYEGVMVQYDWSGKYILWEKPVELSLNRRDSEITGKFTVDGREVQFQAQLQDGGRLRFCQGEVSLGERYSGPEGVNYRLDEADLETWGDRIAGRLGLYSMKLKEPERPIYLEIYRKGSSHAESSQDGCIAIDPNPFDSQFTATFELSEDAPHVEVRIFNHSGMLVEKQEFGAMQKGCNSLTITTSINEGIYVLNIKAGRQVLRCLIAKKGGAQ